MKGKIIEKKDKKEYFLLKRKDILIYKNDNFCFSITKKVLEKRFNDIFESINILIT